MKVKFSINSGANIHSTKSVIWDLDTEKGQKQFGYTKQEWLDFSEKEKDEICLEWAQNHIEIYFEEFL